MNDTTDTTTRTTRTTRRTLLRAAGSLAIGGAALEVLSLTGQFDNRRMASPTDPTGFAARMLELETLDRGGVLHVGQSTHLLFLGGLRILTDPWFFDPAFGSLRHPEPPPIAPQAIGPLDVIAITHDHPDHADLRALDRLDKSAMVIVGVPELLPTLRRLKFQQVEHIDTWQDLVLGPLRVTATPALHDVPEAGFVFRVGHEAIYFAGDTATYPGLQMLAELPTLSLAILPVDGTRLRWEPRLVMDPLDAAQAAALLRPKAVMSSHADAVQGDPIAKYLLSESAPRPHDDFRRLVEKHAPGVQVHTPKPGQVIALT